MHVNTYDANFPPLPRKNQPSICINQHKQRSTHDNVVRKPNKPNNRWQALRNDIIEQKYGYIPKTTAHYIKKSDQKMLVCNNNRKIEVIYNGNKELEYKGVLDPSVFVKMGQYSVELRINFHGLVVKYAVQLLSSILEFYEYKTNVNKLDNLVKLFRLQLDVGKGFSSSKGGPVLGPKLMEYLQDIEMDTDSYLLQEGVLRIEFRY